MEWLAGTAARLFSDVAAVGLQVQGRHRLDDRAPCRCEMPQRHEMVGQALRSLDGPRLEGGQELHLVDQPVLQGQ